MKHEDPIVAQKSATPVRKSRREILLEAAAYFDSRPDQIFGAMHRIEYHQDNVIRTYDTVGTAFAPIVVELNAAGISTEQKLGAVMDNLPMTRTEVHEFACDCNGRKMDGASLAARLRSLAGN